MFTTDNLKAFYQDRTLVILSLAGCLLAIAIIIAVAVQVRPSDVQVPIRCTGYGPVAFAEQCYTDKWYYLLNFIGIGLVLLAQPLISLKLLITKGRAFATVFAGATIVVGIITLLLSLAVLRTASISL